MFDADDAAGAGPTEFAICVLHRAASALGMGPEDWTFYMNLPVFSSFVEAQQAMLFLNWLAYGPNVDVVVDFLHGYAREPLATRSDVLPG